MSILSKINNIKPTFKDSDQLIERLRSVTNSLLKDCSRNNDVKIQYRKK